MTKRIVICCDGTWNTPDQKDCGKVCPSNVAKTALSVDTQMTDGIEQKVYYDKGVGTEWYNRLRGGMSGVGVSRNIQEAYAFLVENYDEGDDIFFFGFSRGAYTVRSTAGLIRNSGLLKRENIGKLDNAFKLYRRRDNNSHPSGLEAELFRKTYSRDIDVKFIGVWDTVGALGIPVDNLHLANKALDAIVGIQFHDILLSGIVKNAFQALAIDERRAAFKPAIWSQQAYAANQGQRLEQAWFAGVHTNIGGGYQCSGLSDCAFEWMRDRAKECGLVFNDNNLLSQDIAVTKKWDGWKGELRDSKTGLYVLIPDYIRPIGETKDTNEAVHETAETRYKQYIDTKGDPYKPANLIEYLAGPGAKITC